MKTALVTGAAGFLGRHVCPLLEVSGYRVIRVDRWFSSIRRSHGRQAPDDYPMNLEMFLEGEAKVFDVVIHLAANIEDVSVRMVGGLRQYGDIVLDYRMAVYILSNPPREAFIVPSSCAVDNTNDPYGYVKQIGERFWMESHRAGVPTVILRPFSGYGEDQAESYPFPAILKRALNRENPLVVWGSGKQVRDFIHVADLSRAFIWAIHHAPKGKPIDIGTGVGVCFFNLANMIAREVGYSPEIYEDETKPESSKSRVANTRLAREFGFESEISLKEGIRRAVAARTPKAVTA